MVFGFSGTRNDNDIAGLAAATTRRLSSNENMMNNQYRYDAGENGINTTYGPLRLSPPGLMLSGGGAEVLTELNGIWRGDQFSSAIRNSAARVRGTVAEGRFIASLVVSLSMAVKMEMSVLRSAAGRKRRSAKGHFSKSLPI